MQDYTAPGVEIKCDGASLSQISIEAVTDVMVESRVNLPGSFALKLVDNTLALIDRGNGSLHEGVRLEISLGYKGTFKKLITGEISTVLAEMSAQGVFTRITGYDMLHRLSRGTSYRRYETSNGEALPDSAIAQTILNDAGLKPTVEETSARNVPRVQDNRSDLDFLTMLAALNDYYLYNTDDRVFFTHTPPNRGELTLTWGNDLRAFFPRLCLNGRVNTLEVRGRDVSIDENYVETVARPRDDLLFLSSAGRSMMERGSGKRSVLNMHDSLITCASDAKQFISDTLRDRQALVTATGSCAGNTDLLGGTMLRIASTGRFDGDYFVTRAIHRLSKRGYATEFEARMVV
ncbi:MAG: hypothetical protein FWE97_03560 [Dehalococcoidia bacterium]|nr:hypothetical protein [Dehalococcoidia bacterium]